jgi:hypothetical protein
MRNLQQLSSINKIKPRATNGEERTQTNLSGNGLPSFSTVPLVGSGKVLSTLDPVLGTKTSPVRVWISDAEGPQGGVDAVSVVLNFFLRAFLDRSAARMKPGLPGPDPQIVVIFPQVNQRGAVANSSKPLSLITVGVGAFFDAGFLEARQADHVGALQGDSVDHRLLARQAPVHRNFVDVF